MYSLLEHSYNKNIVTNSMTSRSLWNYYRKEIKDIDVNNSALDGKSFDYKTKAVGKIPE